MTEKKRKWPVIEDLPEHEQQPFEEWLIGQTVPVNDDHSVGYYPWDYERWQAGLDAFQHFSTYPNETLPPKKK